jgi:hypothetical protein
MPINARTSSIDVTKLLVATLTMVASLVAEPASAARFDDLQLVYHATFANGSLESGVDPLGIGALKFGDSGEVGINPSWTPIKGDYLVTFTRPSSLTGQTPVVVGLDAKPVSFDVGSVVGLRATFVAPAGPHGSADVWAFVVGASTEGSNPIIFNPSVGATLQIRGTTARFNTPGSSTPATFPNIPQAVYDAIFDPIDPQPFTLELLVDRKAGRGEASLKVGEAVFSRTYQFAVFKADSGPAIAAVGARAAIVNSSGHPVSVRVRDFQVFASKRNAGAATVDPLCPAEFGCRLAPPTDAQ